jgi:hypothetical protein
MIGGIHHLDHQLQIDEREYKGAEYLPVKSSFELALRAKEQPAAHGFGSSARRGRFSGKGSIFHHINDMVAREEGLEEERKNNHHKPRGAEKQAAKREQLLRLRITLLEQAVREIMCACFSVTLAPPFLTFVWLSEHTL